MLFHSPPCVVNEVKARIDEEWLVDVYIVLFPLRLFAYLEFFGVEASSNLVSTRCLPSLFYIFPDTASDDSLCPVIQRVPPLDHYPWIFGELWFRETFEVVPSPVSVEVLLFPPFQRVWTSRLAVAFSAS